MQLLAIIKQAFAIMHLYRYKKTFFVLFLSMPLCIYISIKRRFPYRFVHSFLYF